MCNIKEIICPCGELLLRTPGGGSGLKTCLKCGQMVHFDITESGVLVHLETQETLTARLECLSAARRENEKIFMARDRECGEPEE